MFQNKKVVVVMPAYNAEKTLLKTYEEVMAQGVVDLVILVDDASPDNTAKVAASFPGQKFLFMNAISATEAIRKPVTGWRWKKGRIL
jgi:glycosyltransferase involved in cell wall biosynthesis